MAAMLRGWVQKEKGTNARFVKIKTKAGATCGDSAVLAKLSSLAWRDSKSRISTLTLIV